MLHMCTAPGPRDLQTQGIRQGIGRYIVEGWSQVNAEATDWKHFHCVLGGLQGTRERSPHTLASLKSRAGLLLGMNKLTCWGKSNAKVSLGFPGCFSAFPCASNIRCYSVIAFALKVCLETGTYRYAQADLKFSLFFFSENASLQLCIIEIHSFKFRFYLSVQYDI